ncbi:DUF4876 domain-containing protein [Maribellus maritimus]|uniref:DUF4876 domain-containing protein n=1 Tax=Maribellus maritimus TaxID=2870838 RepID=UPI001EEC2DC0|nr:DUF4876 domain-containing protein [Maribellus maritimus]MCG6186234.1 DUF4876 domain-containing protein [Maribellus maritimus]
MKKIGMLLLLLFAIVIISCDEEEVPLYQLTVTVNYPDNYNSEGADGAMVALSEEGSSNADTVQADASGVAVFTGLRTGIYTVSSTKSMSASETESETGISEEVLLTAVENNVSVLADDEVTITLAGAVLGDLVFKEVYYAGSSTPEDGSYFSDQYYEIYNNSTDVIYADNLCIGVVDGWSFSPAISPWLEEYPSKSAVQSFWYIPGAGEEYPINPGESIIIAQDGINHKTDELGNPNSPVDMSNADWETFVARDDNRDIDAPGVPNLTLGYATYMGFDWLTSVFGGAYVIFRIDGDIDSYVEANKATKPGSTSATEYVLIDNEMVIDGFQAYGDDSETSMPKLHATIDAGFTFDPNGTYTGKCVRRKVKTVIDGRPVYQDTNNSTDDFLNDQECQPGVN